VIGHKQPSFVDSHLCFGAVWYLHPYTGFSALLVHNSCEHGPGYIYPVSVPLFPDWPHSLHDTNTVILHSHPDRCSINMDLVSLVLKMQ